MSDKTNEAIVAEAMVDAGAPLMHSRVEEAVVAALESDNRLVGEQTDEEIHDAAIDRARALADRWNDTPDYMPSEYDRGRVDQRHEMTEQLLVALDSAATATAGVAPQAPVDAIYCAVHGDLLAAPRSFRCAAAAPGHEYAAAPPVFDVDKIAEVIEGLDWAAEHGGDDPSSEEIARAVVAHLRGESK